MSVVTRFAPSPTGFFHIGGARTALFNWLFTRRMGGTFFLRIEDTDQSRSTAESLDSILTGLKWLGLNWDGDPIFQYSRMHRHAQVAMQLLEAGLAYRCYCTPQELTEMKEEARAKGLPPLYNGRWRDQMPSQDLSSSPYVIRLKSPQEGNTVLKDDVQGQICVNNQQLDDMILLRSDGTPTYMLSVVVDDHDMGITHVIRGNDHLTNTFRQIQIYNAMGWPQPRFAHIPLIHGEDGSKLSKRHGSLAIQDYAQMGILPEAMCNYLLRLGWSHGDDEVISLQEAINWFSIDGIGQSSARFDMNKLTHLNAHYLRTAQPQTLMSYIEPFLQSFSSEAKKRFAQGLPGLQKRAKTLRELESFALIYLQDMIVCEPQIREKFLTPPALLILQQYILTLQNAKWTMSDLENHTRSWAQEQGIDLKKLAQPLRVALTGSTVSPPIFEVMAALGQDLTLQRCIKAWANPTEVDA